MKNSRLEMKCFLWTIITLSYLSTVIAIKCYQCSSDEADKQDKTAVDSCGAYEWFDTTKTQPVDCNGDDAVTPGTFCYKSIQQGPRGFVWDGRWRTVIRRCAQRSERGISWGCDWGYKENGVYWEECYCAEDACNAATPLRQWTSLSSLAILGTIIMSHFLTRSS